MATTTSTPSHSYETLIRAQREDEHYLPDTTQTQDDHPPPLTPRGPDNRPQSSSAPTIPFHGSCPRCHHFHIGFPFTFSLDPDEHTRLQCEHCQHKIFGLGRRSTQTTLASVESGHAFSPAVCGHHSQQQPDRATDTLNTGRGRTSPSRSLSRSHSQEPTPGIGIYNDVQAGLDPLDSGAQRLSPSGFPPGQPPPQYQPAQSGTRGRMRGIRERFTRRLRPRPREWQSPRFGIRVVIQPFSVEPQTSQARTGTSPSQENSQIHYESMDDIEATGTPVLSAAQAPPVQRVASGASMSAATPDTASNYYNGRNNESGALAADHVKDKHSRLRAQRRKRTREMENTTRRCECTQACSCRSESSGASKRADVGSGSQTQTLSQIEVPRYLLGHPPPGIAQGLALTHMGLHLRLDQRESSREDSSSGADSTQKGIRLSQSTLLGSNGSSNSLQGRPPLSERSLSASAVPSNAPTVSSSLRFDSRNGVETFASRSTDLLSEAQPSASDVRVPSSLTDGDDSHSTCPLAPHQPDIGEDMDAPLSPGSSSVRFADPFAHQGDQPIPDRLTFTPIPLASEHLPVGDSGDATPTQERQNQVDGVLPPSPSSLSEPGHI